MGIVLEFVDDFLMSEENISHLYKSKNEKQEIVFSTISNFTREPGACL